MIDYMEIKHCYCPYSIFRAFMADSMAVRGSTGLHSGTGDSESTWRLFIADSMAALGSIGGGAGLASASGDSRSSFRLCIAESMVALGSAVYGGVVGAGVEASIVSSFSCSSSF